MKYLRILPSFLLVALFSCLSAQDVPNRLKTGYAPLDEKLSTLVTGDSTAVSAAEAHEMSSALFLDAREVKEYKVSHLPGAVHFGYSKMNFKAVKAIDKSRPIVVYCTVGYRSERAAAKLRKKGFTNVYNLYGSLYAWKLAGLPLVDDSEQPTEKLHTYDELWGSFVPDSIGEKVHK